MPPEEMGVDIGPSESVPAQEGSDETAEHVNKLFRRALKVCRKQHERFKQADRLDAGHQWEPEDVAKLKSQDRPTGVFNFIKRHDNVVAGVEILNRLQPQFLPRVIDSAEAERLASLDTGCYEYVMESCDGSFEISSAFRDLTVRGMGFLKARLDMVEEPNGKIVWERQDGKQFVWDPDSMGRQNLQGSRYFIFFTRTPKNEAIAEWPDEEDYIKGARPNDYDDQFGVSAKIEQVVPPPYDPLNKYETDGIDSSGRDHVIVKEAYWYVDENWVEYIDPFDKESGIKEMTAKKWKSFKKTYGDDYPEEKEPLSSPKKKRVWKRAFVIGARTMEESDAPIQTGCIEVMTADWDAEEKVYTGLPHILKDPQQYLNKYLSQTTHSIATSPKGVLLFEDGTFENYAMAEEQWASWAPFIPMKEGALGAGPGSGKKFEYIPPAQPPQILFNMWQACIKVIEQIAGISLELLTGGEGEVPGITMRQRQAVAMIAMAGYFNSYRRFLKGTAVTTLEMVRKFYTDERIIRIGGQYDSQGIKLLHDDLSYPCDIKIDENPNNPNTQDAYYQQAAPILPGLFKSGAIMQVPSLARILPIPPQSKVELERWIRKLGQQIAQAGGTPGQPGQKQGGQQQKSSRDDPRVIQSKIEQTQAKTQEIGARAKSLDADSRLKQVKMLTSIFDITEGHRRGEQEHQMGMLTGMQAMRHADQEAKHGRERHGSEQRMALIEAANAIKEGQQIGQEPAGAGA